MFAIETKISPSYVKRSIRAKYEVHPTRNSQVIEEFFRGYVESSPTLQPKLFGHYEINS